MGGSIFVYYKTDSEFRLSSLAELRKGGHPGRAVIRPVMLFYPLVTLMSCIQRQSHLTYEQSCRWEKKKGEK